MKRVYACVFAVVFTSVLLIWGCEAARGEEGSRKQIQNNASYTVNEQNPYSGAARREELSKLQIRNDVCYLGDEETPYTGILYSQYPNGQIHVENTYKNGKLDGTSKWWWKNGQLMREIPFKNGEYDGIQRWWWKNGQLSLEEVYKMGKETEKSKCWNEQGERITPLEYSQILSGYISEME